jgi:hypothetical protein
MQDFTEMVGRLTKDHSLTLDELRAFNPVEGGIPLPRGTSVIGLDPFKCNVHPTYYPEWSRDRYTEEVSLAPRTAMFHASGDSLVHRLTFRDKVKNLSTTKITANGADDVAVLKTLEPHGLRSLILNDDQTSVLSGDLVNLQYPAGVSRVNAGVQSVSEGFYWAEPLTEDTLLLRETVNLQVIYRIFLPSTPVPGSSPELYLELTVDTKTHHRLSSVKFASAPVLNEYYAKVQQAFSDLYFAGVIDDSDVNVAETEIIIPLPPEPTPAVDDTTHHAPSLIGCYLKSNLGLCGITADGSLVSGTKDFYVEDFSYQSLQNDPDVYEVFYDKAWIPLKEATWRGLGLELIDVTDELALQYLIDKVELDNLRYFYADSLDVGADSDKSSGLTDPDSETRHYSVLSSNNAIVDALYQKCFGAAVGFWSYNGGQILLDNSTITLGTEAIRAEGFSGIGTMGGAEKTMKGFEVTGVRRPSIVPYSAVENEDNHKVLYLNASIASTTSTEIHFTQPVNTHDILPYSLRPGSVLWVSSLATGQDHYATVATGGLSSNGMVLSVESLNNGIDSLSVNSLSVPYIRRFVDPRDPSQRNYYLQLANTGTGHSAPQSGMVLRYAENQGSTVTQLLEPGRQLDPGENGGWNHLFVVHQSLTKEAGENANTQQTWNAVTERSDGYFISLKLGDSFGPWSGASPRGSIATYSNRSWASQFADLEGNSLPPSEDKSEWTLSNRSSILQSVADAYIPTSYSAASDPNAGTHTASSMYVRGLKCDEETYDDRIVIDYDDGTSTFGIVASNVVDPQYIDPKESHSRIAMERFLMMLGYEETTVDAFLTPRYWKNRNFPIAQFPPLDGEGYALSVGQWPVEFNSPSLVQSSNTVWEQTGNHNISKGLSKYRTSSLSQQMRFDSMRSTAWGGHVIAEGQNHFGETLPHEVDYSRKTKRVF